MVAAARRGQEAWWRLGPAERRRVRVREGDATARPLGDVRRVVSFPHATAQCRGWFARHLPAVELVASNSTVKVLKEQAISLNGMLGYYYFYTFEDGPVTAVHAHYFLFSGNKMNILVFQTLPGANVVMPATSWQVRTSASA